MNKIENASNGEGYPNKIQECENEDYQNTKVSLFRIIASLSIALLPMYLIKLRMGMGIGYTIVLLPELSKNDSEIDITLDELTWFSSSCFVSPIACIAGGFIAQYAGVRLLLMFSFLLYFLADLLFHWTDTAAMLLVAQAIVGFTASLSKLTSYTYVAEILQPKLRSVIMASMNLVATFGRFFCILLGNFMHWKTQIFVSLVFPAIGFVFVFFMPDSPQWLASKHRLEDAEKSLARLRGWTTPEAVKAELYSSITNVSSAKTTPENELHLSKWAKLKKAFSPYLDRTFYIPLLTMIAMFSFAEFNGGYGVTAFSGIIFKEINSPIPPTIAGTVITGLSVGSSLIYIFTVRFLGKRIITLASVFIITVMFIVAIIFLHITDSDLASPDIYSWIVSISLMASSFVYYAGLGKVIFFLNSELFPHNLRYVGAGLGYFISELLNALYNKIFLYILKGITFPGTLIFFVIVNIIAFVVIYFILPETEGVTLQQIEENYTSTQNLKNKR